MIKINQFIFPPRTEQAIPRSHTSFYAEQNWIAQYKYNDTHILIKILPNNNIELWNRHGQPLTYTPTEDLTKQLHNLTEILNLDTQKYTLLDGGLIHSQQPAIKNTIAIWDILVHNNNYLIETTYHDRYNIIKPQNTYQPYYHTNPNHKPIDLGHQIQPNIIIPTNHQPEQWDELWENTETINKPHSQPIIEGLFFKNPTDTLTPAYKPKNNSDWLAKSRIKTNRHPF